MLKGFGAFQPRPSRAFSLREAADDLFARLHHLETDPFRSRAQMRGQHIQRRGGPGHEFWQYRDFQPGDHARDVDWRQSARSDRVLTRQKEKETQKKTTIWLQNDMDMQFGGVRSGFSKYESGAIISLALAMRSHEYHDVITLSGVGVVSPDDMTVILGDNDYHPSADDLPGQEIFLIGDFIRPISDLATALFNVISARKQVHLIQILDPMELDLPFSGRTIFERSSEREHILSVETVRDSYVSRLNAHCDELASYCKSRNWAYMQLRNGGDMAGPLARILNGKGTP